MPVNFEQPNAEMKRWRDAVRASGSILSGLAAVEIHHIYGRTTKIKGVGNIGHAAILALDHVEHGWVDWGKEGLRLMKGSYLAYQGDELADQIFDLSLLEFQKFLFAKTYDALRPELPDGVYDAIMSYHR